MTYSSSSIRSGYPELYGPANAGDMLSDPWAGEAATSPMVHAGCAPTDTWTVTFRPPVSIATVYVVHRRDSTSCSGDCGNRIVQGAGRLTMANTAGAVVASAGFPSLVSVSILAFGTVALPSMGGTAAWADSNRTGVRYIKIVGAVGTYLHFRELFVYDASMVNVALGQATSSSPLYDPTCTAAMGVNGVIDMDASMGDIFHSLLSE